jgi:hypothetical protein
MLTTKCWSRREKKNNIQTKYAALQLLAHAYDTLHTYFHAARLASAIWDARGGPTVRGKKNFLRGTGGNFKSN